MMWLACIVGIPAAAIIWSRRLSWSHKDAMDMPWDITSPVEGDVWDIPEEQQWMPVTEPGSGWSWR